MHKSAIPGAILLGLLAACNPSAQPLRSASAPVHAEQKSSQVKLRGAQTVDALLQKIQNKPRQHHPLTIRLDQNLIQPGQKPVFSARYAAADPAGFSTQAEGDQVLETEPLSFDTYGSLNYSTSFQTADTANRHILEISGTDQGFHGTLIVNGNAYPVLHQKGDSSAFKISQLVLTPDNSLSLSLQGEPDTQLRIRVKVSQAAGKIFRLEPMPVVLPEQQSPLNLRSPEFLQRFAPYDGDEKPLPDVRLGMVQVNQESGIEFQTGVLVGKFPNSEHLNALVTQYGTRVRDSHSPFAMIDLALEKAPLAQLPALLSAYNELTAESIQEISFSSLAGMQTFTILLDIFLHHPEWFESLELNASADLTQASPQPVCIRNRPQEDWEYLHEDPRIPPEQFRGLKLGKSWWLVDTFAPEAWQYSLGTGVKVAWMDGGDFRLDHNRDQTVVEDFHPEIKRRVLVGPSYVNEASSAIIRPVVKGATNKLGHGHASLMTGFAERANGIKTAGIAPNAQVIPYGNLTLWDLGVNVRFATLHADLIGGSVASPDTRAWNFAQCALPVAGPVLCPFVINDLLSATFARSALDYAAEQGIPMVFSAGNGVGPAGQEVGVNYETELIPSHPGVIAVGAVGPRSSEILQDKGKNPRVTDICTEVPTDSRRGLGVLGYSNYGPNIVWAPGDHLNVAGDRQFSGDLDPTLRQYTGTSAAAPIVTGAVALMLSRQPGMSLAQIRSELLQVSQLYGYGMNNESGNPGFSGLSERLLNIQALLDNRGMRAKPAETAYAYLLSDASATGLKLRLNQSLLASAQSDQKEKSIPRQTISNEAWQKLRPGMFVRVKGWSNVPINTAYISAQEIELLDAEPICPENNCAPTGLPSWFKPSLSQINLFYPAGDLTQTYLSFRGKALLAQLGDGAASRRFVLSFRKLSDPTVQLGQYQVSSQQVRTLANNGESVELQVPSSVLPQEPYEVRLSGVGDTNWVKPTDPLGIQQGAPPANYIPPDRYEYDLTGNRWLIPGQTLQVDANQFAGIYFNQPIRNLEIKIGPVLVPIVDVLEDLAIFGIPEDLPQGVHDVVVKASNQTLTLEDAVEKISQAIPPTPEPSPPPSADPGAHDYVRIFNLEGNDEGRVYLNEQLILTAHAGENKTAVLEDYGPTPLRRDQRNEVRFEVTNQGGGYTYGFELYGNGNAIYTDIKGTPGTKNVVLRGEDDETQGLVYQERIVLKNRVSPVGSGPYWFKVFNLNEDEAIELNANNDLGDPAWEGNTFRASGTRGVVSRAVPLRPFDYYCGAYNPRSECWGSSFVGFNLENPYSPYSLGIELYKGINLVYRNIQGQENVWGANHNQANANVNISPFNGREYRHYQR